MAHFRVRLSGLVGLFVLMVFSSVAEAAMKSDVTFPNNENTLAGHLYLPTGYEKGQQLPGVVVTGAWTSVKEQMPAVYAAQLAKRGYAVLTFDFRGWGASPDAVSYLEDPRRKTEDIVAAVSYLASRPEVDANRIGGLGICASSGYMSDAALQTERIKSLALVAPWLHDAEILKDVYGGEEGVLSLVETGRKAATAPQPVYVEAASTTDEKALMYQAPYYTEKERGLIPEYDNKFNVASWESWLTYDALKTARELLKPTVLVHSDAAAIPQGAKQYAKFMGHNAKVIWLDDATQFEFYDDESVVSTAADVVAQHFSSTLRTEETQAAIDTLTVKTIVESVASLADSRNFESLERLYADEVDVDYTSLSGGDIEVKSPQALMAQWASVLPGFDCTKHEISDVKVTTDGNTAEATANVKATHLVAGQTWTVEGRYMFRLTRANESWKINFHGFALTDEQGSRDVFSRAIANVEACPPSYLVRQKTKSVVRDFLASLEEKDMKKFASVWANDAVQHMPYAPKGFPQKVVGKENLLKHYAAWPENSGAADFTSELVFYPMIDPEMVFGEFKGNADIVPTKRKYEQSYGGLFHVVNGKITLFREYFNPIPYVYAFGLDEGSNFRRN